MAKIFGATFILVLFLVAFFNGYSVEGAGIVGMTIGRIWVGYYSLHPHTRI
jgi:hypothetical protein